MKYLLLAVTLTIPATSWAQYKLEAPLEVYNDLKDSTSQHLAHWWPAGQFIQLADYVDGKWWSIVIYLPDRGDVGAVYVRNSALQAALKERKD